MDRIQTSLLPLLPIGGRAAEAARPETNRDRLSDFREEFRREVARGHADDKSREPVTTPATNRAHATVGREGSHSEGENQPRESSEISPATEPASAVSPEEEESASADELELSDSSADTDLSEDEGQALAEVVLPAVPAELQGAALSVQEESDLPRAGAATAPGDELTENPTEPEAALPTHADGSLLPGAVVEDPASPVTEVVAQIAVSHLSRSSKMLEGSASGEDSASPEGDGPALAQLEAIAGPPLEAKEEGLHERSPLRETPPEVVSGQDSDLQQSITEVPPLDAEAELTRGSQLESSNSDNRTTQVALPSWATSQASRNAARSHSARSESPQVDPSRFVGRVTRAFEVANLRGSAVMLRLSPPELGAMRVELSIQQGVLSAHLETETSAAKNIVIDNLPALRERLAALDIRVERFDVDVRQDGAGGQPDWEAQQESRDQRQARPGPSVRHDSRSAVQEKVGEMKRPNSPLDDTGHLNTLA